MKELISALERCLMVARPCVLVEVVRVQGSTPREVGAAMLVTPETTVGTIGGGKLELMAIDKAHALIGSGWCEAADAAAVDDRIVLSASAGQCCGGVASLRYSVADAATLQGLRERDSQTVRLPIMLFGNGHVAQALVRVLASLPVRISWVDERGAQFPADVPYNALPIDTDTPQAEITGASDDTAFLVMTHSHALDERLCHAILQKNAFSYFGLIGSASKRLNFERRLAMRGIDAARLKKMQCPIGIAGIKDKRPEVIAVSVAAQLMQVHGALYGLAEDAKSKPVRLPLPQ